MTTRLLALSDPQKQKEKVNPNSKPKEPLQVHLNNSSSHLVNPPNPTEWTLQPILRPCQLVHPLHQPLGLRVTPEVAS